MYSSSKSVFHRCPVVNVENLCLLRSYYVWRMIGRFEFEDLIFAFIFRGKGILHGYNGLFFLFLLVYLM